MSHYANIIPKFNIVPIWRENFRPRLYSKKGTGWWEEEGTVTKERDKEGHRGKKKRVGLADTAGGTRRQQCEDIR